MSGFADAAAPAAAPAAPGIYVFLDAATELLHVGKAGDLRRRLRDHARAAAGASATPTRLRRLYDQTREIRWEERAGVPPGTWGLTRRSARRTPDPQDTP